MGNPLLSYLGARPLKIILFQKNFDNQSKSLGAQLFEKSFVGPPYCIDNYLTLSERLFKNSYCAYPRPQGYELIVLKCPCMQTSHIRPVGLMVSTE